MSDEREKIEVEDAERVADKLDDDFEGHRMDVGRLDDEGQVDVGRVDVGRVDEGQVDVGRVDQG
jgi:hypothetical protein